jgi:hypothetical protein
MGRNVEESDHEFFFGLIVAFSWSVCQKSKASLTSADLLVWDSRPRPPEYE